MITQPHNSRIKLTETEKEVDRQKELYIYLSEDRHASSERVRLEFKSRLENFQHMVREFETSYVFNSLVNESGSFAGFHDFSRSLWLVMCVF